MTRRPGPALAATLAALALVACGTASEEDGEATAEPAPTVTVTVTETVTPSEPATPEPTATATPTPVDVCATPGLDQQAFIFVTAPAPGVAFSSGDTVEGCSNLFEAAYQWELVDNQQTVLDSDFGTASCGTGCVGTFSFTPTFSVSQVTVGHIRVWADSPEDGSPQFLTAIPVLLQP